MQNQNGVLVFGEGDELPELEASLKNVDFSQLYSPYGYKIVEVNGMKKWQCATEAEMRAVEARRLGISAADVVISVLATKQARQVATMAPAHSGCIVILFIAVGIITATAYRRI